MQVSNETIQPSTSTLRTAHWFTTHMFTIETTSSDRVEVGLGYSGIKNKVISIYAVESKKSAPETLRENFTNPLISDSFFAYGGAHMPSKNKTMDQITSNYSKYYLSALVRSSTENGGTTATILLPAPVLPDSVDSIEVDLGVYGKQTIRQNKLNARTFSTALSYSLSISYIMDHKEKTPAGISNMNCIGLCKLAELSWIIKWDKVTKEISRLLTSQSQYTEVSASDIRRPVRICAVNAKNNNVDWKLVVGMCNYLKDNTSLGLKSYLEVLKNDRDLRRYNTSVTKNINSQDFVLMCN